MTDVKQIAKLGVVGACIALSACSVFEGDKIDYKSAQKGVSLEVPPDPSQLSPDSRYQRAGGARAASTLVVAMVPVSTAPWSSSRRVSGKSSFGTSPLPSSHDASRAVVTACASRG